MWSMSHPAEVIVPVTAIFFLFGGPVLAFVFFRVLKHRERMAMIERGIAPEGLKRAKDGSGPPPLPGALTDDPQATLRKGITLTAVGLALTIGLSIAGIKTEPSGIPGLGGEMSVWKPGPALLLGLVPLFVGLARVMMALLSGATLGPPRPLPGAGSEVPFDQTRRVDATYADAPRTAYAQYEGPYTYRPDGTSELRPPSTPPERR